MSLPRVLLVEDERSHQLVIESALGGTYEMIVVSSAQEARRMLREGRFDLLLLDIILADGYGYDVCTFAKGLPQYRHTPVVFLTALADVQHKVHGFELGADDYVVKPCDPVELRARLDSKLKKYKEFESRDSFATGDLVFDFEKQMVNVKGDDGQDLDLTPLEFRLLTYLARNQSQALTREQILENVWGKTTHVMDRSVDTYIAALRRKLGSRSKYIKSVHGVGYRFVPTPDKP